MRTAPVVDQDTYDRITRSLARARYRGASPIYQLNEDGLVWTKDRERKVRVAAIRFILDEMAGWSPAEFLRRRNKGLESATPADMYICIREWIQEHLAYAQTES
jgi:hypothetical protein